MRKLLVNTSWTLMVVFAILSLLLGIQDLAAQFTVMRDIEAKLQLKPITLNGEDMQLSRYDAFVPLSFKSDVNGVEVEGYGMTFLDKGTVENRNFTVPYTQVIASELETRPSTLMVGKDRELLLLVPKGSTLAAKATGHEAMLTGPLGNYLRALQVARQDKEIIESYLFAPYNQVGASVIFLFFALIQLVVAPQLERDKKNL